MVSAGMFIELAGSITQHSLVTFLQMMTMVPCWHPAFNAWYNQRWTPTTTSSWLFTERHDTDFMLKAKPSNIESWNIVHCHQNKIVSKVMSYLSILAVASCKVNYLSFAKNGQTFSLLLQPRLHLELVLQPRLHLELVLWPFREADGLQHTLTEWLGSWHMESRQDDWSSAKVWSNKATMWAGQSVPILSERFLVPWCHQILNSSLFTNTKIKK